MMIDFVNKLSPKKEDLATEVILFAKSQLMPRVRKIFINIHAERGLAKKGIYGDVLQEDDREFTIRIDPHLPPEQFIVTLLHEMVHVYQYATGKMKYKWIHEVIFEKEKYKWDMDYDSRPWEIEAHAKEKQLKEKWDDSQRIF